MPCFAMPLAKRSYRPACSPRPCTTAKVIAAPTCGHARSAILPPSADSTNPSAATALSGAKVPEASEDLERFLLGLQQRWRVRSDAAEGIRPLGARRALRVKAEGRRVEEDAFPLHLLDHRAFRQHVLQ